MSFNGDAVCPETENNVSINREWTIIIFPSRSDYVSCIWLCELASVERAATKAVSQWFFSYVAVTAARVPASANSYLGFIHPYENLYTRRRTRRKERIYISFWYVTVGRKHASPKNDLLTHIDLPEQCILLPITGVALIVMMVILDGFTIPSPTQNFIEFTNLYDGCKSLSLRCLTIADSHPLPQQLMQPTMVQSAFHARRRSPSCYIQSARLLVYPAPGVPAVCTSLRMVLVVPAVACVGTAKFSKPSDPTP
ncbi:hypothetical protein CBL_09353 [Carabus blaptoides fortunei]